MFSYPNSNSLKSLRTCDCSVRGPRSVAFHVLDNCGGANPGNGQVVDSCKAAYVPVALKRLYPNNAVAVLHYRT